MRRGTSWSSKNSFMFNNLDKTRYICYVKDLIMLKLLKYIAPSFHPTRIKLVRQILENIVTVLRPSTIKCKHGIELYIPKSDKGLYSLSLWMYGEYEPEETQLMLSLVLEGDMVIDICANIGYYTCLFAKKVGEKGIVHAFEPDLQNIKILQRNIELNKLKNVKVHPIALSNKTGRAKLYISEDNKGDHTLVPINNRDVSEVQTSTFDELFGNSGNVRLIKIDVQGFELKVLNGMQETLHENQIENMLIEFTPKRVKEAGYEPKEFIDYFTSRETLKNRVISATCEGNYKDLVSITPDLVKLSLSNNNLFNVFINKRV